MAGELAMRPTSANVESIGTIQGATLLLQVWSAEPAAPLWGATQPWIAMLRQAVVSSGGTLSESGAGDGGPLAATFLSEWAAVRASRRLHALATGYAMESKGQLFGITALICPSVELGKAALLYYLQQKARPAQTVLAAKQTAAPPASRRIKDVFFSEFVLYELAYAHREDASQAAETLLREHRDRPVSSPPLPPHPLAAKASATSMLVRRLSAWPRSIAAVFATLLAITAGVVIARRPATTPVATVAPIIPIVQQRPAPAALLNPLPSDPVVKTLPGPPQPRIDHARKPPPVAEPAEAADKPRRGRSDLTAEQIRQILTRGQNALDRGCYTEAIGYYRRVLDDDPRNGSATGGLEKARIRLRLSGEHSQCAR